MEKAETVTLLSNLAEQFEKLETTKKLDDFSDSFVERVNLRAFLDLMRYKLSDEEVASIEANLCSDSEGEAIKLVDLYLELKDHFKKNSLKREMQEAFRVFDQQRKGRLSVSFFRLVMKKYSSISDEDLDLLIMDCLEMKKLAPIEAGAEFDYVEFVNRLFELQQK